MVGGGLPYSRQIRRNRIARRSGYEARSCVALPSQPIPWPLWFPAPVRLLIFEGVNVYFLEKSEGRACDSTMPSSTDPSIHRIGFLGGTFDPIHQGHVSLALEATNAFSFQRVLCPAYQAPLRDDQPFFREDRLAMVESVAANYSVLQLTITKSESEDLLHF